MTRAMSRELGGDGICVNTLAPGLIMSDSLLESKTHSDATVTAVVQSRAIKRDAFPEDLLGALVFLASKESDFITGQVIAVDGGSTNT
jgi:NAD(P)-dependent dehydrogenase (short-subunit alcohol dehydrogenase family)